MSDEKLYLLDENERLVYQYGRAEIYYRRPPQPFLNALIRTNTKRGVTDFTRVQEAAFRWMVVGWKEIYDQQTDKPAPCDDAHKEQLPRDIIESLIELGGIAETDLAEAAEQTKNS